MDWRQLAYWNSQGSSKSFAHPLRLDWLAALPKSSRILDYGCGYGRNLAGLTEHGWSNTLGVDFAAAMIERGRELHPQLDLRVIDGLPLDEPDGAFDAALLFAVLTCIPGDEEQREVIAELGRLLKPGGLLLVSDYPLQTDVRNVARYEAGHARHGVYGVWDREDGGVFRHHDPAWFGELLSGFEVLQRAELESVTMGGNAAQIVQTLARKSPSLPP
jgi:SAM-dependent methyltransferase